MNIFEEFIKIVNDQTVIPEKFYAYYSDYSSEVNFDEIFPDFSIEIENEDHSLYYWRDWEIIFKISKNNNFTFVKIIANYDPDEGILFDHTNKFTEVEKSEKMFIIWPDKKELKNNQDCKICKGTGKVILFINTVDCECLK